MKDFGFNEYTVELSTRPKESIGTDADWKQAEEALTAVKSVFTTADLARNRPAEVLKASNLFSSRHGGFCREITVRVLRELHGNRHYSHLPWVTAAYGRVVKGGKEHGLEILPAQECERALSHEAA